MTFIVPDCDAVRPDERVPRMFVRNDHAGSVSIAEPMPTNPPPLRKYASKTARCASVSGLAMPGVQEHDRAILRRGWPA